MTTEETYKKLKKEVETAKTEAERATGALDQLMSRLKDEFECETLKQGEKLLNELEGKKDRAEKEYERALTDYEKKWKKEDERD